MQRTIRPAAALLLAAGMPLFAAPTGPNPTHPRHHAAPEPKLTHGAKPARAHQHEATRAVATAQRGAYKQPFAVDRHGRAHMSAAEARHAAHTQARLHVAAAPMHVGRGARLHAHMEPIAPIHIPEPVHAPEAAHTRQPIPLAFRAAARTVTPPPPIAADALIAAPTHDILLSNAPGAIPPLPLDPALLLRGSHDSLVRQNTRAVADGLERIEDDGDIRRQVMAQTLVPLPMAAHLVVDPRLPDNRRYTRPWTAHFLRDISAAFGTEYDAPLIVTSAVRTVDFQRHLVRVNGNAAPPEGEAASPHLYGGVVDIGKHGLTARQMEWVRAYLRPLVEAGKIDVAEEFRQACFHISVYRSYVDPVAPRQQLARDLHPAEVPAVSAR